MIGPAHALADEHDVIRVRCSCGQPMYLGLEAGPTFNVHRDRRADRSCRVILLPDARSRSVSIERLRPGDSAEDYLKRHRAQWLDRGARRAGPSQRGK